MMDGLMEREREGERGRKNPIECGTDNEESHSELNDELTEISEDSKDAGCG
jgi:hypothetical protein